MTGIVVDAMFKGTYIVCLFVCWKRVVVLIRLLDCCARIMRLIDEAFSKPLSFGSQNGQYEADECPTKLATATTMASMKVIEVVEQLLVAVEVLGSPEGVTQLAVWWQCFCCHDNSVEATELFGFTFRSEIWEIVRRPRSSPDRSLKSRTIER